VLLDIGSEVPIATTSMGRAYLCALPETKRNDLLDQIRACDEANWPAIIEGVGKALEDYRKLGFCMSLGDWRTEVHGIAVPLVMEDGTVMVFSCSGPSFQMTKQLFESEIGPRLINLVGNVRTALSLARS
jgi:DNA-binding IclR family transcriptional regulator